MNQTTPQPTSLSDQLSSTIHTLTGVAQAAPACLQLGPGLVYLLELPSRKIAFFDRENAEFPKSFHALAETALTWDELLPEDERPAYAAAFETETPLSQTNYPLTVNKRGATVPVVDHRQILFDAAGNPVALLGKIADDSFRSLAMDSLVRRSWKEIATTMTRRLLHDFNNTIAGIYSLSELYAEPGSDAKSMTEAMGHIRDCSIRAQDIAKRIRHLTTLENGEPGYFDLATLIRDQTDYLSTLLPKGSPIHYEIEPGDFPIKLDPNQFRQSLLHLAANACDSAGDSVELTLTLRRDAQNLAILEIADNGPGFKPELLETAKQPFVTSKDNEKHPGLGLSIVETFARSLGGNLAIENAPNSGAIVRLTLSLIADNSPTAPIAAPAANSAQEPTSSAATSPSDGPPCLLVYSWEDIARHPLVTAMQNAGWQTHIHLEPGDLLIDLLHRRDSTDGILIFKSSLDERAEPLVSELGNANTGKKIALIALGETLDALNDSTKRHCGFIHAGPSKPSALLSKLETFYR